MKYEKLVNEILGAIGSKDNIKSVVHCATDYGLNCMMNQKQTMKR